MSHPDPLCLRPTARVHCARWFPWPSAVPVTYRESSARSRTHAAMIVHTVGSPAARVPAQPFEVPQKHRVGGIYNDTSA